MEAWESREHKFTHYRLIFTPIMVEVDQELSVTADGMQWHLLKDLDTLGLPAPIRVLLKKLTSEEVLT